MEAKAKIETVSEIAFTNNLQSEVNKKKDCGAINISVGAEAITANILKRLELQPCQWLVINGIVDESTFDKAARHNIQNNNWDAYKSISERNDWYKWADKIARKKDNYWFAAAVDVTSWRAVGAADIPNLAYVTNKEEYIMRYVNSELLRRNFKNFGPYLLSDNACVTFDGQSYCHLKGVELEKQMVVIEQTEVGRILPSAKAAFEMKFGRVTEYCFASLSTMTNWDCAIWGINRVSDGTCKACSIQEIVVWMFKGFKDDAYQKAVDDFKRQFPNILYDFGKIEHRIFIGQTMAKYLRQGY
jgi:hypothetical protein